MELAPLQFMLSEQLSRCEHAFKDALLVDPRAERTKRRHQLEGVLSDAWQSYCLFVRMLAIRSSTGCKTSSGTFHVASITPPTWERASHIALREGLIKAR